MQAFEYARPKSVEDAARLLAETPGRAAVLAGGTDLLSLMKDNVLTPSRLVSLQAVDGLATVREGDGEVGLGALLSVDELVASERVKELFPSLVQAAEGIRSPQIRNMGTLGGELCQRPRCWYYRSGFGLLGQNASGQSLVVEGDNRYHAILGNDGPAYFVNPSSLAPPLIALGAQLKLTSSTGSRQIPLADFYRIPRTADETEHDLGADEIVTEVSLPTAPRLHNATYEVRAKESLDWPLAAAGVALELDGEKIASARVVLGHVAPRPWVSEAAAAVLVGQALSDEVAQRAGEAAVQGARALSRNHYKVQLARVAVKRALLRAAGREV